MEEEFTFIATRVNPILVAITDNSNEVLEYVLEPDISVPIDSFEEAEETPSEEETPADGETQETETQSEGETEDAETEGSEAAENAS